MRSRSAHLLQATSRGPWRNDYGTSQHPSRARPGVGGHKWRQFGHARCRGRHPSIFVADRCGHHAEPAGSSSSCQSADPSGRSQYESLAERLCALGAKSSLVKGGHLNGPEAVDVLFDGSEYHVFRAPRVATNNTHGTGDTLSSATAAYLARGKTLVEAIHAAKRYLTGALAESERLQVGGGHGPVHHFHALWPS